MVMCKQFCKQDQFKFDSMVFESVRVMDYLGFKTLFNGNVKNTIDNRILKAKRMAGWVFQAIRTSGVAFVKLAMSLFDKQIKTILLNEL